VALERGERLRGEAQRGHAVAARDLEQQVLRERPEAEPVLWAEPPATPHAATGETAPEDVRALLADLAALEHAGRTATIADGVARGSSAESFLRLSLLPLVGDARAGEGFAGQLGALPLEVEATGDGWPEPLDGRPLAALTPGHVAPRALREPRHG
jgi:hypothetical protein